MLSAATALLDIELAETEVLRMSGEDVRDFYHQFRVSGDRALHAVYSGRCVSASRTSALAILPA